MAWRVKARGPAARSIGGPGPSRLSRCSVVVQAQSVPVTIKLQKRVQPGESFRLVGNRSFLGDWDTNKGPSLKWSEGDQWTLTTDVPVGKDVEFKILLVKGDQPGDWEGGGNRKFKVLGPEFGMEVECAWGETNNMQFKTFQLNGQNGNGNGHHSNNGKEHSNGNNKPAQAPSASRSQDVVPSSTGWVGAAPEFVRSRLQQQRKLSHNTDGMKDGVVKDLVEGDKSCGSWLQKLGLQKKLLVEQPKQSRPGVEALASVYAYATWINTGAIPCAEDGGHHRPNHHANLALQMFRSLEWVIGEAGQAQSEDQEMRVLAARRLHSRLPSFSGEFRQSVPLTRIRDIAHRNDIPQDLKNEIKHTLQNKLHRSAGPEDLVASEAMLAKITRNPGEFNDAFVNEFKIFMKELREFFNATGLVDLLEGTVGSMDESNASAVHKFLTLKSQVEGAGGGASPDQLVALLAAGTEARSVYLSGLSAGLRNDVTDDILSGRQRWRLAEIRLEDFNFVLLSRLIGTWEDQGAATSLSKANNAQWTAPLTALTHGIRNLGLSGFAQRELMALENELQAWHGAEPLTETKEAALRAKASLERVLRVASDFSERVMTVYAEPAATLGDKLGVPPHMARVFGESEIRSSIAFQVSKLSALLIKSLRLAAGLDAWDGLVTGESVGKLLAVESLSPEALKAAAGSEPAVVLLVRRADGDEELGPLGSALKGVILQQELAHLSHLGVRARQEQVPFATVDDEEYFNASVKPFIGKNVRLSITSSGVTLKEASAEEVKAAAAAKSGAATTEAVSASTGASAGGDIKKATSPRLVKAEEFTLDTCGSKSINCRALEVMAKELSKAGFSTPTSVCLPFGSMDLALAADSGKAAEAQKLVSQLESKDLNGEALDKVCAQLQSLISSLSVPAETLKAISAAFSSPGALLAVRSSANVEDLAGMSAAGLYESVVGVKAENQEAVRAAVAAVWASLYARRAVLSRRSAGVPQASASMAVLVQQLFVPEISFVLHSMRPRDSDPKFALAEVAPGQGETLASGTRGSPWRFEIEKDSGKVFTLAFANFSRALVLPPNGNAPEGKGLALVESEVDYSKQRLSVDAAYRTQVVQRLGKVAVAIEEHFKGVPQDIEGGLIKGDGPEGQLYIFQTRPQS